MTVVRHCFGDELSVGTAHVAGIGADVFVVNRRCNCARNVGGDVARCHTSNIRRRHSGIRPRNVVHDCRDVST